MSTIFVQSYDFLLKKTKMLGSFFKKKYCIVCVPFIKKMRTFAADCFFRPLFTED